MSRNRALRKVVNYSKVLSKHMGQLVVFHTVSVPHPMLITLCKTYPEQFFLAPLFLEGLEQVGRLLTCCVSLPNLICSSAERGSH